MPPNNPNKPDKPKPPSQREVDASDKVDRSRNIRADINNATTAQEDNYAISEVTVTVEPIPGSDRGRLHKQDLRFEGDDQFKDDIKAAIAALSTRKQTEVDDIWA